MQINLLTIFSYKVAELEVELDEQKEKFRHLENSMTNGEKSLKKKVTALEQNLESLTLIYHQLVSKMTITKVENQVKSYPIYHFN